MSARRIDGKPRPARGANPKGIIIYDADGHMACQVAPDRVATKAGKEPTGDEAKAALADHIAYFGTYSIDEQARTVTHHRARQRAARRRRRPRARLRVRRRPADPAAAGAGRTK